MRGKRSNLVGRVFTKLTVIADAGNDTRGNSLWVCECECGTVKIYRGKDLLRGNIQSCGCLVRNKPHADLSGNKYGKLTVESFAYITDRGHTYWNCKCDCGNIIICSRSKLLRTACPSCGCDRREKQKRTFAANYKPKLVTKYGRFKLTSRIVQEYVHMVSRCYNKKNPSYDHYGDKGITVSKKWYNPDRCNSSKVTADIQGIETFIEDMYESYVAHVELYGEKNTTLDRVDGSKKYSKHNCRWATFQVQNNNLSSNRHIYDGEEILTFSECVRKYIPKKLIKGSWKDKPGIIITSKLDRDWSVDQILTFLFYAQEHQKLLKKKDMSKCIIYHIDQSCVYEKYRNEVRFPEYDI